MITFDLGGLERINLMSRKRADLDDMLLLNISRKPYMGSPIILSHLTLSDFERSKSRSLRFEASYLV